MDISPKSSWVSSLANSAVCKNWKTAEDAVDAVDHLKLEIVLLFKDMLDGRQLFWA